MNPEQNRKKGGARLLKPSSKKAEAAPEKEKEAVPTKKSEFTDKDVESGRPQKAKKPKKQPQKSPEKKVSTNEAGRIGDRPYARGRSYKEDRYDTKE